MSDLAHPIPLTAFDRPLCVVGTTGSGKTYAAKGAVEQLLDAGRRVCVVDPTGVWWGLRLRADGAAAYPVAIFGGEHANVPIGEEAGGRLGAVVADATVRACVVDTSAFGRRASTRFLTAFFETLYARNRAPLHLVVDEADSCAPQRPAPDGLRLLGVVDDVARRGRVKGLRLLSITQRPAVLNKNVLTQVTTLVALRLGAPQDRRALEAWIQGNVDAARARAMVDELPKLGVGEGFVWSADRLDRVAFPPISTFDSSRAPEEGDAVPPDAPLPAVDVAALRAALEPAAGEEAEAPMRRRAAAATSAEIAAAERRGYERGHAEGTAEGGRRAFAEAADLLQELAGRDVAARTAAPEPAAATSRRSRRKPRASGPAPAGPDPAPVNRAAAKMLAVLDTAPPVWMTWAQCASLARLKARGGHFNAGKRELVAGGRAIERGELVRVAQPSAAAPSPTTDPAALVDRWAAVLPGAAPRILRQLHAAGPQTPAAVAAALGLQPNGGHWAASWRALRDNDLVTTASGRAALSSLFAGPEVS